MNQIRFIVMFGLTLFLAFSLSTTEASAQGRNPGSFGIGLGQGTIASGLSLKHFAGPTALQGNIGCFHRGWGWSGCGGLAASADFLVNMPALASSEFLAVAWNWGGGPGVGISDDHFVAAGAFVLGLELNFMTIPIDLVLELRPSLLVVPDVDFGISSSGHIRFYLY